jgi:hypothetical protein
MEKKLFKNISILLTDRDVPILEKLLADPAHADVNIDLGKAIETDDKGRITFFVPTSGMKWALVFFLQNLMIRQRLEAMDAFLDANSGE